MSIVCVEVNTYTMTMLDATSINRVDGSIASIGVLL
jgi:hypothetical protein